MTEPTPDLSDDQQRAKRARRWVLIAGASAAGAALVAAVDWRARQPPDSLGDLISNARAKFAAAQSIVITTRDGALTVAKRADGWALRERGDYPVKTERAQSIFAALERAQRAQAMTRDPARLDRLGLGDPADGGAGVRVGVFDARGQQSVDVRLGFPSAGGVFALQGDDAQAYRLRDDLPRLHEVAAWIDLRIVAIARDRIRSVDIAPPIGPRYRLERDEAGRDFRLASPFESLAIVAPVGVSATANGLINAQLTDIAESATVTAALGGEARLETFDGLILNAEVRADPERIFLRLSAAARAPVVQAEADQINAAVRGYDFLINDLDARTILAPLETLARLNR